MSEANFQRFGKYEIIEELGRGGMGIVYKARDPIIGRIVALKTIVGASATDPDLLKRFYREAQSAGQLQHPNIVTIYDLGEADGRPFIAMEFLEGESLEKIIGRRQPMPLARKLDVIRQFCRGLDFAHKHDIVHRDVKPANIFVKTDGVVKVVDFSTVRVASTTLTQTGVLLGTIPYMSPEQVSGQHVDQRSDIFSVGTVAYEFLTHTKPFDGPNMPSIMLKIVQGKPAPLSQLVPDIPPALEAAIMRCFERRPEDRYQSLEGFILELEPLELSLKRQMIGDLVGQGKALYEQREYSRAKEVLRNVLVLDSSHDAAKELMDKVNTEMRRTEMASRIQRLVDQGNDLLRQGKHTEAGRTLEEALKLDSHHEQARSLLEEARTEAERERRLREGLSAIHAALSKGNLTVAEAELNKVLELDAANAEAQLFKERVKQARQFKIREAVLFPRHLLMQERYEEAIKHLEELQHEFPREAEIEELIATARGQWEEQKKRRGVEAEVAAVNSLIAEQNFAEAAAQLERLRAESAQSEEIGQLYESARHHLEAAIREQRVESAMAAVQDFIREEKYDAAVERAQRLRNQEPESSEAKRLLEFARDLKQSAEQKREVAALCQTVKSLLNAAQPGRAVQAVEEALKRFPGNRALESLLVTAREDQAQEATRLEREARQQEQTSQDIAAVQAMLAAKDYSAALERAEELARRYPDRPVVQRLLDFARTTLGAEQRNQVTTACEAIQGLLDAGLLERAFEEAERALYGFPGNADIIRLWMEARRKLGQQASRSPEPALSEPRLERQAPNSSPQETPELLPDAHAAATMCFSAEPSTPGPPLPDVVRPAEGGSTREDSVLHDDLPSGTKNRRHVLALATAALMVVCVLAGVGYLLRRPHRPPAVPMVDVDFSTNPPGATLRVDGQDQGTSPRRLRLAEGTHQLEALMEGYQPLSESFIVPHTFAAPITLTLQPFALKLRLFTKLERAQVQLDGQPAGEVRYGKWVLESVDPGRHTLALSTRGSEASVTFEAAPATVPALNGQRTTKHLRVVTVSTFGSRGLAQFSFKPAKISVDDQASAEVKAEGLELKDLAKGTHTLAWEAGQVKNDFESDSAPVLSIFIESDSTSANTLVAGKTAPPVSVGAPTANSQAAKIEALHNRAYEAYGKGNYAEPPEDSAIAYAKQALELDANDSYAKNLRDRSVYEEARLVQDALKSNDFSTANRIVAALAQLLPGESQVADLQTQVSHAQQEEEAKHRPPPAPKPVFEIQVVYALKQNKYPGTLSVIGGHLKLAADPSAGDQSHTLDVACSGIKDISNNRRFLRRGQPGFRVYTKAGETYEFLSRDASAPDKLKSACKK